MEMIQSLFIINWVLPLRVETRVHIPDRYCLQRWGLFFWRIVVTNNFKLPRTQPTNFWKGDNNRKTRKTEKTDTSRVLSDILAMISSIQTQTPAKYENLYVRVLEETFTQNRVRYANHTNQNTQIYQFAASLDPSISRIKAYRYNKASYYKRIK